MIREIAFIALLILSSCISNELNEQKSEIQLMQPAGGWSPLKPSLQC